ncbi:MULTISPECIES: hypothetical protein [unclassified Mesorhizobium]|uniref:hypothetical protein n=1 Tax=unclassified Mesorhizobium TaxID=325217 RepID=UPI00142EF228|nr:MULTISPECIES: hypothetical protein [unclassified Mesorhizobium]
MNQLDQLIRQFQAADYQEPEAKLSRPWMILIWYGGAAISAALLYGAGYGLWRVLG